MALIGINTSITSILTWKSVYVANRERHRVQVLSSCQHRQDCYEQEERKKQLWQNR